MFWDGKSLKNNGCIAHLLRRIQNLSRAQNYVLLKIHMSILSVDYSDYSAYSVCVWGGGGCIAK